LFDFSAWGAVQWVLIGTTAAFFLGPPLILGLAALFFAPGLLGRVAPRGGSGWSLIPGRRGPDSPSGDRPPDTAANK
jgi:hypothetical protein